MGLLISNKEVNKTEINKNEEFKVKLSLSAEPDIINAPKDIVLVLDKSGSMNGTPIQTLKTSVEQFMEILDEATDGKKDGRIGNGSKVGVVEFNTTAQVICGFTDTVSKVTNAVNAMSASGSTNHKDAFVKAYSMFTKSSKNEKIIIIFTDGISNSGLEGFEEAKIARDNGVTIYSIGLQGAGGTVDDTALKDWATDPDSAFVLVTPNYTQLQQIFEYVANNISKPGATNAVLTDVINPCFEVVSVDNPTKGRAVMVDKHTVKWTIDELGAGAVAEGATFEFTVKHSGACLGELAVNQSYSYVDSEGNVVVLPDPKVTVKDAGGEIIITEDDPAVVNVVAPGCSDYIELDAGDITMTNLGRIVEVSATIKNICPNKNVAVAIVLHELDDFGVEHKRGLKTMLIPKHQEQGCRDVLIKCVKFVVPEALDTTGSAQSICNIRAFRARIIANYVDTDYHTCADKV